MLCPDCGHDNIDGVDVCEACGQSLIDFDPSGSEIEQVIVGNTIEVLSPNPAVTVAPYVTVRQAIDEMTGRRIGCLLVQEDGRLAGIFTERDVLNKVSADPASLDRPVAEFMTESPETITSDDSIAYALHAMDLGGYRHMPIVDGGGQATGVISVRDVLRFLCNRFAELNPEG